MSHIINVCRCGAVISQCRCPHPNKPKQVVCSSCPSCAPAKEIGERDDEHHPQAIADILNEGERDA